MYIKINYKVHDVADTSENGLIRVIESFKYSFSLFFPFASFDSLQYIPIRALASFLAIRAAKTTFPVSSPFTTNARSRTPGTQSSKLEIGTNSSMTRALSCVLYVTKTSLDSLVTDFRVVQAALPSTLRGVTQPRMKRKKIEYSVPILRNSSRNTNEQGADQSTSSGGGTGVV